MAPKSGEAGIWGTLKDVLGYAEGQVVACDLNNDAPSSTFHVPAVTAHTPTPWCVGGGRGLAL